MAEIVTVNFDLTVSGLTEEQVDNLLSIIVANIELAGGTAGGGYSIEENSNGENAPEEAQELAEV